MFQFVYPLAHITLPALFEDINDQTVDEGSIPKLRLRGKHKLLYWQQRKYKIMLKMNFKDLVYHPSPQNQRSKKTE